VNRKIKKIEEQLSKPTIDIEKLKEAVWKGVPTRKLVIKNKSDRCTSSAL